MQVRLWRWCLHDVSICIRFFIAPAVSRRRRLFCGTTTTPLQQCVGSSLVFFFFFFFRLCGGSCTATTLLIHLFDKTVQTSQRKPSLASPAQIRDAIAQFIAPELGLPVKPVSAQSNTGSNSTPVRRVSPSSTGAHSAKASVTSSASPAGHVPPLVIADDSRSKSTGLNGQRSSVTPANRVSPSNSSANGLSKGKTPPTSSVNLTQLDFSSGLLELYNAGEDVGHYVIMLRWLSLATQRVRTRKALNGTAAVPAPAVAKALVHATSDAIRAPASAAAAAATASSVSAVSSVEHDKAMSSTASAPATRALFAEHQLVALSDALAAKRSLLEASPSAESLGSTVSLGSLVTGAQVARTGTHPTAQPPVVLNTVEPVTLSVTAAAAVSNSGQQTAQPLPLTVSSRDTSASLERGANVDPTSRAGVITAEITTLQSSSVIESILPAASEKNPVADRAVPSQQQQQQRVERDTHVQEQLASKMYHQRLVQAYFARWRLTVQTEQAVRMREHFQRQIDAQV